MSPSRKHKILAGAVAALAVAGGGAAIAATQLTTPSQRSAAIVADAAQKLGVEPKALSDALKAAEKKQVDAAVAAGELTKEQGDALKARIEASDYPVVGGALGRGPRGLFGRGPGGPGGPGFGHHGGPGAPGHLDTAATYLGVTQAELWTQLGAGKSLADVAKAEGKSASGLVDALVADEKKELDAAVAAGRLTAAQQKTIEADLEQRVTDMVNGKRPTRPDGARGFRQFGPPAGWAPAFNGPRA
jgi:hypothetical protein